MTVEFLSSFNKDLSTIQSKTVLKSIKIAINKVESAKSLREISGVKKLSGYKNAFRIRVQDYRIGIFIENRIVQFARIVHRKDIYRVFP